MAVITFLSDFGFTDHYVAAVKSTICNLDPEARIIDISHNIVPYNLAHSSFVLDQVFRDFPKGSVHLFAVNSHLKHPQKFVALSLEGHFFVGSDNGIFGLISDQLPSEIVELSCSSSADSSFPAKEILAPAAVKLLRKEPLKKLGAPVKEINRFLKRQVKATKKQITGTVVHVDNYGNLITNIEKELFEHLCEGRTYAIHFGREVSHQILDTYGQTEDGECFTIFNCSGLLEIGINKGNASQLLGLAYDSQVSVIFAN